MLNQHYFAYSFAVLLFQLHAQTAVLAGDAKPKLDVVVPRVAQENETLRSRVAVLQRDLESLTAQENAARSEVESLKAQLAEARAKTRDAEQIEARLNLHVVRSRRYLDTMTFELMTLQSALQRGVRMSMIRNIRMSRRYRSAKAKIAALEQRIAAQAATNETTVPPIAAAEPAGDAAEAVTPAPPLVAAEAAADVAGPAKLETSAATDVTTALQTKEAKAKKKRSQIRKPKKDSFDAFDLNPF